MNRRNFLKRIAAVAAGAVVVPTAAKKLPWTSYSMIYKFKQARDNTKYSRYYWHWIRGLPDYPPHSSDDFLYETSFNQKFPLGSWYHATDGRFFRYVKTNKRVIRNGVYTYVDSSKNIVRHTT